MAYNPGNQNNSGQLIGQGILQAAQGLSQGWMASQQKKEQDKIFQSQSKATESLLKAYMPKEQVAEILAVNPEETPAARHARLTGTIENFVVENKLKQFQAAQQQADRDQRALAAAMNQFLPQNGRPEPFNPQRFLGTYFQQGGSPQSLDKVDQALKMFAPQPGKPVLDLKSYRSSDPTTGKPIEVTVDELTGKEIGRGPLADAAKTEINMGGDSYEKEVGRLAGEQHMKEYAAAVDAPVNIGKLDEVSAILKEGDPTTGIGAELINNLNRIRSNFMADKKAGKSVTDTQVLDALLGSDVFPQIGALGIGARGLDTPAEREFLRQVMTGTINLDKDALVRLTDIRRNVQLRALEKFKRSYDKGTYKKFFEVTGNPVPDLGILDVVKEVKREAPKMPEGWSIIP